VGSAATASAANSVAVGSNATAGTANSVALGNGSTTTAATPTASTTIQGQTYNFAGANPVGVVSVGAPGAERQIQNVAAGQLSATSTDAVNGSQLYATNQAVNNIQTGGGIKYFHANSQAADSQAAGAESVASARRPSRWGTTRSRAATGRRRTARAASRWVRTPSARAATAWRSATAPRPIARA
jgi:autotransporter adhesin